MFGLTGALPVNPPPQHTDTHTSQLLPIYPPKHKFRYRHSFNRGLIVLLLLRVSVCVGHSCMCVQILPEPWITPFLQTWWSVTIETRRWIYPPHARESETHSTVGSNTHAHTGARTRPPLGMALDFCWKTAEIMNLNKVITTNNGKEHASSFSHVKHTHKETTLTPDRTASPWIESMQRKLFLLFSTVIDP